MTDAKKWLQHDIGTEFAEAKLGDARRTSRLMAVARATESMPDVGFPLGRGFETLILLEAGFRSAAEFAGEM